LRNGSVGVGGTNYVPPIPIKEEVAKALDIINKISNARERAIEYFCYAVRAQLFWDGNKRTSTIVASKILIEAGEGLLTIGKANALDFNEALLHFYDTEDKAPLEVCLKKCIKILERTVTKDEPQENNKK
jgi:fido (protein-threonine AMPylation protein)